MKRLGTLDASWLAVESEDTPMHVGNLQIFSLPEGAPETFLRDMVARMKEAGDVAPPWGYKLAWSGFLGRLCPAPAVSASWVCWCRGCTPTRWIFPARCGNAM
jgi:hypothetical protein